MFYSLALVAAIYLLINLAFVYAVPLASFAGSALAAGTVAHAIFGAAGELLVRVVVIVSLPSAVSACLLMASRTLYSMSRDGLRSRSGDARQRGWDANGRSRRDRCGRAGVSRQRHLRDDHRDRRVLFRRRLHVVVLRGVRVARP
jgi:hypothetical protein